MYLDENTQTEVKKRLEKMDNEVHIHLILGDKEDSDVLKNLMGELTELSDKLVLVEGFEDLDKSALGDIENKPLIVLHNKNTKGTVKYHGIPAGYEFGALLDSLLDISNDSFENHGDEKKLTEFFEKNPDKKVNFKVFVTPTCPHCPSAAYLAYKLGTQFKNVEAQVFEANSFPELSTKYNVQYVPKIVLNEKELDPQSANLPNLVKLMME